MAHLIFLFQELQKIIAYENNYGETDINEIIKSSQIWKYINPKNILYQKYILENIKKLVEKSSSFFGKIFLPDKFWQGL